MKKQLSLFILSVSLIAVTLVLYSAEMNNQAGAGPMFAPMGPPSQHGPGGPGHPMMFNSIGFFKLIDDLDISNPQLLQLRIWFQKNTQIMKAGHKRHLIYKKLSDPTLSLEDAKKIAAEEGKAVEESIISHFQQMQELRKILSEDQFKKLHERPQPPDHRRGFTGDRFENAEDDSENER